MVAMIAEVKAAVGVLEGHGKDDEELSPKLRAVSIAAA